MLKYPLFDVFGTKKYLQENADKAKTTLLQAGLDWEHIKAIKDERRNPFHLIILFITYRVSKILNIFY